MGYGINYVDSYHHAAVFVDKIVKGGKPDQLPVEQPATCKLVINIKTAKALGLTIPPSILARADEEIELIVTAWSRDPFDNLDWTRRSGAPGAHARRENPNEEGE
jgi:ABC transporter substrate binding protein